MGYWSFSKPGGLRGFLAEVYSFFLPVLWTAFEPAPVMPDSVSGSFFESRVLLLRLLLDLLGPGCLMLWLACHYVPSALVWGYMPPAVF